MSEVKRTLKEKLFIDAYVKHKGNATLAYMEISPDCKKESARVLGWRWLRKVNIKASELLDMLGANNHFLAEKLVEGLKAKKVISVIVTPPKENKSSTGDLQEAGPKDTDFIEVNDLNTRYKYLDMAYKLTDQYPTEKHKIELPKDLIIKVKLTE